MQPDGGFRSVDEGTIGLDRSTIDHHGQIQLIQQHPQDTRHASRTLANDDEENADDEDSQGPLHRVRTSINDRRHDTAAKLKKKLHISKPSSNEPLTESAILANSVTGKPESQHSRLISALSVPDKQTVKNLVHNPIDTVKDKTSRQSNRETAANIAAKEISHDQEVKVVDAYDAIKRAENDRDKLLAIQDLNNLIDERQNTFVRWTFDRHIAKVRRLPRDNFVRKSLADFETDDNQEGIVVDWKGFAHHQLESFAHQYGGQYIGYGSDPPQPSKKNIMPNIERLILASTPFQEFVMTTRRVYRWERPLETTKFLTVYVLLWTWNLLLPGFLSVIVYLVLQRRFHAHTIEDLREDIKRTEDTRKTALSLNEYIEKRGEEQWADEIVQELGSWLMVQLADMANFFEVMRNFYEWRVPSRTIATLSILVVAILITTFVPLWFLVKGTTFSAGVTFFGLFPIATNFPDYRLLASPAKRIFWNIPTHAEWAVKYLQAEGIRHLQDRASYPSSETPPSDERTEDRDLGSYTAHHDDRRGRLIIGPTSVRFTPTHSHEPLFNLPYDRLERLEKSERVVGGNLPKPKTDSGDDMKFVSRTGEEWVVKNVDLRDQAFSQVVGFSGVVWQIVW